MPSLSPDGLSRRGCSQLRRIWTAHPSWPRGGPSRPAVFSGLTRQGNPWRSHPRILAGHVPMPNAARSLPVFQRRGLYAPQPDLPPQIFLARNSLPYRNLACPCRMVRMLMRWRPLKQRLGVRARALNRWRARHGAAALLRPQALTAGWPAVTEQAPSSTLKVNLRWLQRHRIAPRREPDIWNPATSTISCIKSRRVPQVLGRGGPMW